MSSSPRIYFNLRPRLLSPVRHAPSLKISFTEPLESVSEALPEREASFTGFAAAVAHLATQHRAASKPPGSRPLACGDIPHLLYASDIKSLFRDSVTLSYTE